MQALIVLLPRNGTTLQKLIERPLLTQKQHLVLFFIAEWGPILVSYSLTHFSSPSFFGHPVCRLYHSSVFIQNIFRPHDPYLTLKREHSTGARRHCDLLNFIFVKVGRCLGGIWTLYILTILSRSKIVVIKCIAFPICRNLPRNTAF